VQVPSDLGVPFLSLLVRYQLKFNIKKKLSLEKMFVYKFDMFDVAFSVGFKLQNFSFSHTLKHLFFEFAVVSHNTDIALRMFTM